MTAKERMKRPLGFIQKANKPMCFAAGLILAAVLLFGISSLKSKEEKLMECFVDEMRGHTEEMREAVGNYCKLKTNFKK